MFQGKINWLLCFFDLLCVYCLCLLFFLVSLVGYVGRHFPSEKGCISKEKIFPYNVYPFSNAKKKTILIEAFALITGNDHTKLC